MKKSVPISAAMATILLFLSGCASGAQTALPGSANIQFRAKHPVTIGYSVFDLQDPYFQTYAAGIKEEAARRHVRAIIADAKSSQLEQVSNSASLISRGISALIVSPVQPAALPATINQAHRQKIPVIIGDVGAQGDYDAYILSDNRDGGKQAAEYMKRAFSGRPGLHKIGIVDLAPGVVVGKERSEGFKEEVARDPHFRVVASLPGQTVDTAYKATQDMLSAHPDLDGIYAMNSNNVQGAARAIQASGKGKDFKLVGFNGDPVEMNLIREGTETATVAQDPYAQGKLAVETALRLLEGKSPRYDEPATKTLRVPIQVVDSTNLDAYLRSRQHSK
ncbi:substrate-binding domain-containing protein [Streptomyces hygroscopicus]|uniref:substrate-binding domain-containing protein n=1 Tax=Streptomyces hygroscopicus TaxID=1912 RepID=UPI003633163A